MAERKAFPCHRLRSVSADQVDCIALPTVRPYSQIDLFMEAVRLEGLCDT